MHGPACMLPNGIGFAINSNREHDLIEQKPTHCLGGADSPCVFDTGIYAASGGFDHVLTMMLN